MLRATSIKDRQEEEEVEGNWKREEERQKQAHYDFSTSGSCIMILSGR